MRTHSTFIAMCVMACAMLPACKNRDKDTHRPPVRVETMTVASSSVADGKTYSGVIEESSGTVLSFKVAGTIMNIAVSEGQRVEKGQLIATLDDSNLRGNYEISKAALATARDTYDRMKMLHDANAIPEMKWVEVQNTLRAAESACRIAGNTLGDARIHAPFGGIISEKLAEAGATAAPGMPVVKLVDVSPVKASISVAENEIGNLVPGSAASITAEATGGVTVEGKLTEKGVAADPFSRTYTVKFTAVNPDGKLLPGMLCNVAVQSDGGTEAIVIPVETVLLDHSNSSFVWTVRDGKAEKRAIRLGGYTPAGVIAAEGLTAGDVIIVSGQQKVSEGMSVTPVNR